MASAQSGSEATFDFNPVAGKPGRVLDVSGTNCFLDGRPLEFAFLALSRNVVAGGGEPFSANQTYPVGTDGSWAGEFPVPTDATPGPYTFSATCGAADFFVRPVDKDFTVLDQPPPTVDAPPSADQGTVVSVTIARCTLEDGSAATDATITLLDAGGVVQASTNTTLNNAGAGSTNLALPESVPSGDGSRVALRCENPAGALAASTPITINAAPGPPSTLSRTG